MKVITMAQCKNLFWNKKVPADGNNLYSEKEWTSGLGGRSFLVVRQAGRLADKNLIV